MRKHFIKEHSDIMPDVFNHYFKMLQKCQNKFHCLVKEILTVTECAIGLDSRESIYVKYVK